MSARNQPTLFDDARMGFDEALDLTATWWPRGWDGTEPLASLPFDNVNPDGSVQPIMRVLME